jgi:seryl-tRNA synthetase
MKKKNKPYFHELGQNEIDALIAEKRTVGYVIENYNQPDWCKYPKALSMFYGCFSLCDLSKDGFRTKISKDFCKDCDCFNDNSK